jgi:hypothetical protein
MSVLTNSGLSRTIDNIFSYFAKKSHKHSKSDITDFPTSMLANGGNASTVNGHTVNSNVPANAKFTDTTYSKLSQFTDDIGYVKNTDSRLTDSRNAKDVYAWAKLSTKPSYTASKVGAVNAVIKTETDYNKITPDSNTVLVKH